MSRLIREEDALKIIRNGWSNHCSCKDMCDEISCLPTAYNVEEVVKELEEAVFWTASTYDEDGYYNDDSEEAVYLDKAIEIVKGGVK